MHDRRLTVVCPVSGKYVDVSKVAAQLGENFSEALVGSMPSQGVTL